MLFFKKKFYIPFCAAIATAWHSAAHAFWGTTEVDLKGITIIKEAAEILAAATNQIPGKATGLALIGLIITGVGIATLHKGLVNALMPQGTHEQDKKENRRHALVHVFVSIYFMAAGILLMSYASTIAQWL